MSEQSTWSMKLHKILSEPGSNGHVENLLDVIAALLWDCNFQSAKNSKAIQSFVQRYSELANVIYSERTKFTDFELVKVIGQGGFGRVQLVRHKDTRRVYAMKMMSKQHLLDHSQSGYWEERDIMSKADSEWLVSCYHAFVDKENIYLCMEYMPGGDLYYWLEHYDTFTEEQACFYLAETVLALETLHGLNYIHRDLKPDNMLLDAKGHLKLADFGSCVRLDAQGRYFCSSPIGTPDYISPEMLNCQSKAGYIGPVCDWWALGVIAFEMLFGETAFYGQSLVETYSRILNHEKSLKIPTDTEISAPFESLIRGFLRSADSRLGATGASDVMKHPFFGNIDWAGLRSTTPPIKPVVSSEIDTSNINFDESELRGDYNFGDYSSNSSSGSPANLPRTAGAFAAKKPTGPPAYFTGDNLAFAGFTFNRDERHRFWAITKNASTNNGDVNSTEKEAALAEARAQLRAMEKQGAMDKIAIKEAQNRLYDVTLELDAKTLDLERVGEDAKTKIGVLRSECDTLNSRVNQLQSLLLKATEDSESERKTAASLKEELALAKSTPPPPPPPPQITHEMKQVNTAATHNSTFETDLEEARQRSCQAEADIAAARKLHAVEIADLTEQLQAAKTFSQLYKSQLAEAEEVVSAARKNVQSLTLELEGLRANLEASQSARKELKNRVFTLESELAVARVDLEGKAKTYDTELREATSQITRLKESVVCLNGTVNTVTDQRDNLMVQCRVLEENVDKMTTELLSLRRESEIQKIKIDQTVTKLIEVASVAPSGSKKKKNTEAGKVASLMKDLKNAEHKYQKNLADLQSTLNRLKTDNEEKTKALADLTEVNRTLEQELERSHSQMNALYECYDIKAGSGERIMTSNMNAAGFFSSNSSPTGTLLEPSGSYRGGEISLSLENLQSIAPVQSLLRQPVQSIENICDFPEKVRGRKKLAWTPKFVVICPFSISFYPSKEERDLLCSVPCEEISIQKIFSVRPGTLLDLTYATEDDVSRLISIVSDEITPEPNGKMSVVRDADSTGAMGSAPAAGSTNFISWYGHSFQPMTFRITNAICEVCGRSCSDLRSPPLALECVRCRMRIHRNHVEEHKKLVVCPKTVRQWLIRAPSAADRKIWISYISQLKQEAVSLTSEVGIQSPGVVSKTSLSGPRTSGSNSVRYRSLRNIGALSLKDIAFRRHGAFTLPRHNSTSTAAATTSNASSETVIQSPPPPPAAVPSSGLIRSQQNS